MRSAAADDRQRGLSVIMVRASDYTRPGGTLPAPGAQQEGRSHLWLGGTPHRIGAAAREGGGSG